MEYREKGKKGYFLFTESQKKAGKFLKQTLVLWAKKDTSNSQTLRKKLNHKMVLGKIMRLYVEEKED